MFKVHFVIYLLISVSLTCSVAAEQSQPRSIENANISLASEALRRVTQRVVGLSDEQIQSIKTAQQEAKLLMNDALEVANDAANQSDRAEIVRGGVTAADLVVSRKVREVLTEPQLKRLQQVVLNKRLEAGGLLWVVESTDVVPEIANLRLTPEQRETIAEVESKVMASRREELQELIQAFRRDVEALKRRSNEEILSTISDDQRTQLKDFLGDAESTKEDLTHRLLEKNSSP